MLTARSSARKRLQALLQLVHHVSSLRRHVKQPSGIAEIVVERDRTIVQVPDRMPPTRRQADL